MSFAIPNFTRGQLNRAGEVLIAHVADESQTAQALALINHWRACHAYPINTFQATLRQRLDRVGNGQYIVARRLKRVPSIEKKLRTNTGMQLARMQDVGGLRAIVGNLREVNEVTEMYCDQSKLTHQLVGIKDYIREPKDSGYRSVHLIYRYENPGAVAYKGLSLELQIRTNLQHAWATAVETMGTFLDHALKSSEGPDEWLTFFQVVGAAFAILEQSPVHVSFEGQNADAIFKRCASLEAKLQVRHKLGSFAVASKAIFESKAQGSYHLIVLNASLRNVTVKSFGEGRLDEANAAYAAAELQAAADENDVQCVLVATDSVKSLRRAFPNYFLDTRAFASAMRRIEKLAT